MKILLVSSEVVPYSKTGGLADVAGALPRALSARGHDVRIVTPRYQAIDPEKWNMRKILPEVWVNFPGRHIAGSYYEADYPMEKKDAPVKVYAYDCPEMFDRPGLYGENGNYYWDNPDRFACFCMSVVWLLKSLDWKPDIIHCNDWQTSFLPVFLRSQVKFRYDKFFKDTRILYTIHNLVYQGLCDFGLLPRVGLSPALFQAESMEYWGALSPMKGGIAYSDWLSTVSPTYAHEIRTQRFGCGIEGFIAMRESRLSGILNGVDTVEWDPATDKHIAANYSVKNMSGKKKCRKALQERLGWPVRDKTPIIALINRLDSQKGIDLLLDSLPRILETGARVVVLGSGRADYEHRLREIADSCPDQMRAEMIFDNALAHQIEAGADMFLMCSAYEPCGLNQMFSLMYGTPPIVHCVGGLADTVRNASTEAIEADVATGFHFYDFHSDAVAATVRYAVDLWQHEPDIWRKIQKHGMTQDFTWDHSALHYENLFKHMLDQPSPLLPTF